MINRVRHQEDGYLADCRNGMGLGLDDQSHGHVSFGVNGKYSKLLNRFLQLDGGFSTGYTTVDVPSLISYLARLK